MSESEAAVGIAERPTTQEKSYTINDVARDIANKNPEVYGPQGEFPIFKEGKFDSRKKEDIDQSNLKHWMRREISQWYEEHERQNAAEKQPNKISRLLKRIIPPRNKQMSSIDMARWDGNLEDAEKFIMYSENEGPIFKKDEYMQFVQKRMTKANFDLAGPSD